MSQMQRRVRFDHEDLDAVPMMVRTDAAALLPGLRLEIEVGARWAARDGHRHRVDGHWVACEVITDTGRDLVVKLLHCGRD